MSKKGDKKEATVVAVYEVTSQGVTKEIKTHVMAWALAKSLPIPVQVSLVRWDRKDSKDDVRVPAACR